MADQRAALTPTERALLDHIADEDVTRHGRSFRLWHDDHDYGLVTAPVKRLVADGFAQVEHTYMDRGIVRLTEKGQEGARCLSSGRRRSTSHSAARAPEATIGGATR